MIKRLATELSVIVLLFCLSLINNTFAQTVPQGFNDLEKLELNDLSTTTLDFSLRLEDGSLSPQLFNETNFKPGDANSKSFHIVKEGELDFQYQVSAVKTGGDIGLCNALQVEAKLDGVTQYSGSLLGLTLSPTEVISAGDDSWTFILSLNDLSASLQDKSCQFNFVFTGWQTDSDGSWGFMDQEIFSNNLTSGNWGAFTGGTAVVINEIMWMGSEGSSADEWIELRNMTGQDINISNWRIDNAVSGAGHFEIPNGYTIPANGYFLIANYNVDHANSRLNVQADLQSVSINFYNDYQTNGQLVLKDNSLNVIDRAPLPTSANWPQGSQGGNPTLYKSMERNITPGDGTLASSWHTCESAGCLSTTFWDSPNTQNYGTPKALNLSENDSTSLENSTAQGSPLPQLPEIVTTPPQVDPIVESSASAELAVTPTPTPEPELSPEVQPVSDPQPSPEPEITPTPALPELIIEVKPELETTSPEAKPESTNENI